MAYGRMRVYDVLGVDSVCEECSDDMSIMYVSKDYKFSINGEHVEGVNEFAKWVYGDDSCDGQAAVLAEMHHTDMKDYSGDIMEIERIQGELATGCYLQELADRFAGSHSRCVSVHSRPASESAAGSSNRSQRKRG